MSAMPGSNAGLGGLDPPNPELPQLIDEITELFSTLHPIGPPTLPLRCSLGIAGPALSDSVGIRLRRPRRVRLRRRAGGSPSPATASRGGNLQQRPWRTWWRWRWPRTPTCPAPEFLKWITLQLKMQPDLVEFMLKTSVPLRCLGDDIAARSNSKQTGTSLQHRV